MRGAYGHAVSVCSSCSHPQQLQVVITTEERSTWVHAWLAWSCHEGLFTECKHAVRAVFDIKAPDPI